MQKGWPVKTGWTVYIFAAIKFHVLKVQVMPFNFAVLPSPQVEGRYIQNHKNTLNAHNVLKNVSISGGPHVLIFKKIYVGLEK